jgi:hypothetical protein
MSQHKKELREKMVWPMKKQQAVIEQPTRETLQAQHAAVSREQTDLSAKLGKATAELTEAQALYDQVSRAHALGDETAQPLNALDSIQLIQSRISALTAMLAEKTSAMQHLQQQINVFVNAEARAAWLKEDRRLLEEITELDLEIKRLDKAVADARVGHQRLLFKRNTHSGHEPRSI